MEEFQRLVIFYNNDELNRKEFFKGLSLLWDALGPFGHFTDEDFDLGPYDYSGLSGRLFLARQTLENFGENPYQGDPGKLKALDGLYQGFPSFTFSSPPEYHLERFLGGKAPEWSPELVQEVHDLWKTYLPKWQEKESQGEFMRQAIRNTVWAHGLKATMAWYEGRGRDDPGFRPHMMEDLVQTFPELKNLQAQSKALQAEYKRMLVETLRARGYSVNPDWSPTAE